VFLENGFYNTQTLGTCLTMFRQNWKADIVKKAGWDRILPFCWR